jgi:hypothetical protein
MGEGLGQVQHVDARRAGQVGERNQAEAWATVGQGPNRASMASTRRLRSVRT